MRFGPIFSSRALIACGFDATLVWGFSPGREVPLPKSELLSHTELDLCDSLHVPF